MANYLVLGKPQTYTGLGTIATYVVPAGTLTQNYTVRVQQTYIAADPISKINAGSGQGLGSGTGGGSFGFTKGDQGAGNGGVGQGFGAANSYQQPPVYGSNTPAPASATTSEVITLVKKNSVTQFTGTTPAVEQSSLNFSFTLVAVAAADTIELVLSSAAASDNQLSGVTTTVSISQGL